METTEQNLREVADLLFGGGADELIEKMNPDSADIATRKKRERTQARIGLASNVVGLAAGVAGTKEAYAAHKKLKKIPRGSFLHEAPKLVSGKTKALAAGALGLQVANIAGDAVANRVLARSAAGPKKKEIHKDIREIPEVGQIPKTKGEITRTVAIKGTAKGVETIKANKGKLLSLPNKVKTTRVRKDAEYDVRWEGEFSKVNADKQQVFGWASIVELNGEPVVDLQGDYISIDEVEKSAYEYVHKSRKGGDMHLRDGDQPVISSNMIESFVVTPEKKQALGLPDDAPTGWWVGFQVNDPELWSKVKSGQRTGFSIHGRGVRTAT